MFLCAGPSGDVSYPRSLKRLKASRESLESFDKLSSKHVDAAVAELQMHCQLLKMVKADLDHVYQRIRSGQ